MDLDGMQTEIFSSVTLCSILRRQCYLNPQCEWQNHLNSTKLIFMCVGVGVCVCVNESRKHFQFLHSNSKFQMCRQILYHNLKHNSNCEWMISNLAMVFFHSLIRRTGSLLLHEHSLMLFSIAQNNSQCIEYYFRKHTERESVNFEIFNYSVSIVETSEWCLQIKLRFVLNRNSNEHIVSDRQMV